MAKPPVHVVKYGFIKCCIWENSTRNGHRYSVSMSRLYKNGDVWQESTRFGRDDLLLAAKAMDAAHTWICQSINAARPEPVESGNSEDAR